MRDAYASVSHEYIGLFGGACRSQDEDVAFVERHLTGLRGPVLDLGCGPGQWTAHLHSRGAEVIGVDVVPGFIAHARAAHPGMRYELGSMTDVAVPEGSVAGVLAWYSTIHLPPTELPAVLAGFRRLLRPSGVLVIGFFDSDDVVAAFDHKVVTAYRWPVGVMSEQLAAAGLVEVQRLQQQPDRPDRKHAAIAARAS